MKKENKKTEKKEKKTADKTGRINGKFAKGNKIGNRFTSENQPTPEAKKKGWVKRNDLRDEIAKLITKEHIVDILKNGTPKEKIELIKAILPPEKQTQEILGNLGIEKIFITQEEKEATDKHIDDVINDGLE